MTISNYHCFENTLIFRKQEAILKALSKVYLKVLVESGRMISVTSDLIKIGSLKSDSSIFTFDTQRGLDILLKRFLILVLQRYRPSQERCAIARGYTRKH